MLWPISPTSEFCENAATTSFQLAGGPPVVAIEERYDLALAFRNACIEGGGLTSVGFADQADLRGKFGDDLRGTILRAVVHHEDFAVRTGENPVPER